MNDAIRTVIIDRDDGRKHLSVIRHGALVVSATTHDPQRLLDDLGYGTQQEGTTVKINVSYTTHVDQKAYAKEFDIPMNRVRQHVKNTAESLLDDFLVGRRLVDAAMVPSRSVEAAEKAEAEDVEFDDLDLDDELGDDDDDDLI